MKLNACKFTKNLTTTAFTVAVAMASQTVQAESVQSAEITADCNTFTLSFTASLTAQYEGSLFFNVMTSPQQPGTPIDGAIAVTGNGAAADLIDVSQTFDWPAPVSGTFEVFGSFELEAATSVQITDFDPIVIDCEQPQTNPQIVLEHEISLDSGSTYVDADTVDMAPNTFAPSGASYQIIVRNIGDEDLTNVLITEAERGIINLPIADLPVGAEVTLTASDIAALHTDQRCATEGTFLNEGSVTAEGVISGIAVSDDDPTYLVCVETPPVQTGEDGCTPGYWKQPHHMDSWMVINPADLYASIFNVDASSDVTMLEALSQRGGGESALMRHATAALLNAYSTDVAYGLSVEEIIDTVATAYETNQFNQAKNALEILNESNCPLN